jgi:PKD repeat protein
MKKSVLLIAVAIVVGNLVSCTPDPSAKFTYDKDNLEAFVPIEFKNTSADANKYEWDFGDDTETSDEANPSHTYLHGGIYTVSLTATSKKGSDTYSEDIEVNRPVLLFPGEMMLNIELGEDWSTAKTKIESGYTAEYEYWSDYDVYCHTITDVSDQFYIYTVGSSASLSGDDFVLWLEATEGFEGTTPDQIGIGDNFSDVKSIYGTPDQYDSWFSDNYESSDYDALGITFAKKTTGSVISMILIYPPSDKSAFINQKFNIPANELKRLMKEHISK